MRKDYLIWILKGIAMGAADAIPGISGGTIALITGIYDRFIGALASFKPSLWQYVSKRDFKGLWVEIDGAFLLSLGIGIGISLVSMLNLMHWLLAVASPVVWSFFLGVIIVSLWQLMKAQTWPLKDIVLFSCGLCIAAYLATATATEISVTPVSLVLGGMLAISAMLLPGISGSFMLTLLGLYPVVIDAVHDRSLPIIMWVALGCLIGIVSFSRILQWALKHWYRRVMSFMLGFVAGALIKVWPWQDGGHWYLPQQFMVVTEKANWLPLSIVAMLIGGIAVFLLYRRA